jgi:hypothetical protein
MLTNWKAWLHGVASAFITGGATAFSASLIKPETFNLGAGFHDLLKLALASGLIGASAYLKNSPLPAIKEGIEAQKGNQP